MKKRAVLFILAMLMMTGLSSAAEPPCRQRIMDACRADQEEMICSFLFPDEKETVGSITDFLSGKISTWDEKLRADMICARLNTKKEILNIKTVLDFSPDSDGRYSFTDSTATFRFQITDPSYPNLIKEHQKIEQMSLCSSKEITFDIKGMVSDADAQYQGTSFQSVTFIIDDVQISNIRTVYAEGGFEVQRMPLKRRVQKEKDSVMGKSSPDQTPLTERKAPGDKSQPAQKSFTNSIGMEFVWVPVSSEDIDLFVCEKGKTVSSSFYLGKYEVTQKQWEAVMGNNPSNFKGPDLPVEEVSWNDAQAFIKNLNEKEGKNVYRLPSEAEWEHAARAGSNGAWCFGDDESLLVQYAWYDKNSGNTTHPVGKLKPNAFGLYDMHGNVYEWCEDADGSVRVLRGGSWNFGAGNCRSVYRYWYDPGCRLLNLGFRVLAVPAGR